MALSAQLVNGRACGLHVAYYNRRVHVVAGCTVHIVYCKLVDCNPLTTLFRVVLDLDVLYN